MTKTQQDYVERLAMAAGAIVREFEEAQAATPRNHLRLVADNGSLVDAEIKHVTLLAPIEDEAPKLQATTARGALFQLLLAAGDIGELVGTEYWDRDALRKRHQRIEGCIHSVLNFLERECGLDRDDIGGPYFAYRSYVPEIWREAACRSA